MSKPYYQLVSYRLLRLLRREVAIRVGSGILRVPTASIESLALMYWNLSWKTEIIRAVLARRSGAFLDVGVNVGMTLLDFLTAEHSSARYIGFEPNPKCVSYLRDVIRRNELHDCTLVPAGLADRDALLKLYLAPGQDADSAASIIQSLRPTGTFETMWVPCFRFDALRESLGVEQIALIKIDVEGAELEVLRGMANSIQETNPYILCEVLHADAHADEAAHRSRNGALRDLLHAMGYAIWNIEKSPGGAVVRLERIEAFPFKRWTRQNSEECDYLFVPRGAEAELENFGFRLTP